MIPTLALDFKRDSSESSRDPPNRDPDRRGASRNVGGFPPPRDILVLVDDVLVPERVKGSVPPVDLSGFFTAGSTLIRSTLDKLVDLGFEACDLYQQGIVLPRI
jgi:hypothetical protein